MSRKRNVSENATGSAAAPARAKKTATTTTHSRRTKATATEPETTAAPAVDATPQAAEPETVTAQATPQATDEQIARLAYSYWEARGHQGGSPEEDWTRAEQELRG
jgi:hypothetical protein